MKTLQSILKSNLSYDSSWGVWAEVIDGEFKPESEARFGQRIFENGGMLDDFRKVGSNEWIVDRIQDYTDGDNDFLEEAIADVIDKANIELSQTLEDEKIMQYA